MSWKVAHLDDFERVPVEDEAFSLRWLPVRDTLGLTAFGTNAYVADEAGLHVVEPHTEDDQEELYFVARGSARFTLGEGDAAETFSAPAGTYVALPEPSVRREAIAEEAGTTVLTFGSPIGKAYEVSEWEERFRAEAEER